MDKTEIDYSKIIAVTNRHLCTGDFLAQVERVCTVHPKAVILREKDMQETEYERLAGEVLQICRLYQVECILHSFSNAAKRLGVKKIHVTLQQLRRQYEELQKSFEVVGVSTHGPEEALEAQSLGASYVTAGHVYATDCKKGVPPRGLRFLEEVCKSVDIPVYGIGGIRLDRLQINEVMTRGAKGACIMSGMMGL